MANPVCDAEGAELGKVSVVEDKNEVAWLVAQRLDDMAMAAWKIPDVARQEIVGLRTALGIDHRGPHRAFSDEGPLRRGGVPVKLAHHSRLHAHGNTRNPLRDRQLFHCSFLAIAALEHAPFRFFQLKLEGWKLLARGHGIRNIVLEAVVATFGADGDLE